MRHVVVSMLGLVSVSLALAACGPSKVQQCNAFVEKANKIQAQMDKVSAMAKPAEIEKFASDLEAQSQDLLKLDLKDEKLAGFRKDYSEALGRVAKLLKDKASIEKQLEGADEAKLKDLQAKDKAVEEGFDKEIKGESKLVDDINKYCQG